MPRRRGPGSPPTLELEWAAREYWLLVQRLVPDARKLIWPQLDELPSAEQIETWISAFAATPPHHW